MRCAACLLVAVVCLVQPVSIALAQDADADQSLGQRMEIYTKLQQSLLPLFNEKQYEKAAAICRRQMRLLPDSSEPHYNLACAMARLGEKDAALLELNQAVGLGFTDTAHMRQDDDLAALREEPRFKDLLKAARDKELNAPHEPGEEIAGVKTIENFPESGLRYRLRIDPDAGPKHPARLLVWLHPSGASMDDAVEQMAPRFVKDGFALVVFTQKSFEGWSGEDVAAMQRSLADIGTIEGVDAKKPVLLGFSAGGQMALELWQQKPGDFGGLIVDAAYPLDEHLFAMGQVQPLTLPKDDALKQCPVYAVVGGSDGGSALWNRVDKSWRDAGIPLTVHVVPNKSHEWLFHAWRIGLANG